MALFLLGALFVFAQFARLCGSQPITIFPIPSTISGSVINLMATGPDHAVWMADGNGRIIRMALDGTFTAWPVVQAWAVAFAPNGTLYFTAPNAAKQLGRMSASKVVTYYSTLSSNPYACGLVFAYNSLYFCEYNVAKIGRLDLNGVVTEWSTPTAASGPIQIVADGLGNLYFTEEVGKIGKMTSAGVFIAEYNVSPNPFGLAYDSSSGFVWFSDKSSSKCGKMSPSGVVTMYTMSTSTTLAFAMTIGPGKLCLFSLSQ